MNSRTFRPVILDEIDNVLIEYYFLFIFIEDNKNSVNKLNSINFPTLIMHVREYYIM